MKAVAALLLIALTAAAGTVRLAWMASPDAVQGYRIYAGTNSPLTITNAVGVLDVGTNLTATVTTTNAGRWYFIATAYDANKIESVPSNELTVNFLSAPRSFGVLSVESSVTLTNGWSEFYRIKLSTP